MRRSAFIILVAAALLAGGGGHVQAWFAYPPDDRPDRLIVEIDGQVADVVPLSSLPEPFDAALGDRRVAERLSYRWRYGETAQGRAMLIVDEAGRGDLRFEFAAREPVEGVRYGAAMVLLGPDEKPLHTFYARADPMRKDSGAPFARHRARFELVRPPDWWRGVEAIAFFRMTYHPSQKVDGLETWRAMRRAVWRLTKGEGTEQRG
jgi:hypothetical protein